MQACPLSVGMKPRSQKQLYEPSMFRQVPLTHRPGRTMQSSMSSPFSVNPSPCGHNFVYSAENQGIFLKFWLQASIYYVCKLQNLRKRFSDTWYFLVMLRKVWRLTWVSWWAKIATWPPSWTSSTTTARLGHDIIRDSRSFADSLMNGHETITLSPI